MSEKVISKTNTIRFAWCYAFIVILDLICGSLEGFEVFRYFTKPSILIALLVFFIKNNSMLTKGVRRYMLLAIIFSLIGDVFLLFDKMHSLFFIGGLASFLMAHIFYVLVFAKKRNKKRKGTVFLIFTLVYGAVLFCVIQEGLAALLMPVAVYMIIILTMSNMAYLRKGMVPHISYGLVFIGSLFFMLSDSLLAINMFHTSLFLGNILIMSTYAIAQFLIVYGVLNQEDRG
ncbi:lysoplasmalogenase [uncultured Aquimarina sp.]|uniref:lysoplasmalogenase n=1 Tax=uncultured Aquimarina sp. TaxID=575652 RepID=UPI00262A6638|nr:lysoplasmalogenase [uncultured Aquimarina sp.]